MYKIFNKFHVSYIAVTACLLFLSAYIINKIKSSYTILFFLIYFIFSNISAYPFFRNINRTNQQKHHFSKSLVEKKLTDVCYDISSFSKDYYYIQYLLKDTDINLCRNWLDIQAKDCNYLITNKSVDNFSSAVMIAKDNNSNLKLYDLTRTQLESLQSYLNINLAKSYVKGINEEGFYGVGGDARWSNGHVKLIIPLKKHEQVNNLKIGIGAIPPQGTKIKILVDDTQIFNKFYNKGGFEIVQTVRRRENKRSIRIDIISDIYVPSKIDKKRRDNRELGVHIYMIKIT